MQAKEAPADLLVVNAKVYTLDRRRPWASAIAIRDQSIIAVGTNSDVLALAGPKSKTLDCAGRLVLPGLFDSHCHAFEGARADLFEVRLSAADDFDKILDAVSKAVARRNLGAWLKGAGWSLKRLPEISADAALQRLDDVTNACPTVLRDSSHHALFANSAAMALAGISRNTVAAKGVIGRRDDGSPSGVFLEEACALIDRAIPDQSEEEKERAAQHAVTLYNKFGVTGFTHAVTSEATMRIFKTLEDAGKLSVWIATCIALDSILTPVRDGVGPEVVANRDAYRAEHIGVDFAKFFMDGVPGARTAAFALPYAPIGDEEGHLQSPLFSVSELRDLIEPLDRQGIHVKVHAVGDLAVRATLDAIEQVRARRGGRGPQHSIAHLSYIAAQDIARLRQLDVLADLCPPLWFPNQILSNNSVVLGDERGDQAWPIRDIVRSGAAAVMGSDWPIVPSPNPWSGLSALVTRMDPTGAVKGTFRPEQALSLEEALPLCTINVARSMGIDDRTGSITPGKRADFILVDRDIFSIDPRGIAETRVLRTYFAGRAVHDAGALD